MNDIFRVDEANKSHVDEIVELQIMLCLEDCPDYKIPNKDILREGIFKSVNLNMYVCAFHNDDNKILGCARSQPFFSDWESKMRYFVDSVYVLPDFRKKGIARKMMTYFIDAHENCDITLLVHRNNVKAVNLYRSLGFLDDDYIEMTKWAHAHKI